MIPIETPANIPGAVALAGEQSPLAAPTTIAQATTPGTPISIPTEAATNVLGTPAAPPLPPSSPPRGSMSEDMGTQLQRLGVAKRYGIALDTAAAANPKPAAPGSWARNILAAVPSVLSGYQNTLEDIGAAQASPIPMGASGLAVGAARAAAAQRQRKEQAFDQDIKQKHAIAQTQIDNMQVAQARRLMAKNDPDQTVLDDAVKQAEPMTRLIEEGAQLNPSGASPDIARGLTEQDIIKRIQLHTTDPNDPNGLNPAQFVKYPDGKKIIPGEKDQYGNPRYEQTFSLYHAGGPITLKEDDPKAQELVQRFKDAGITLTDGEPITLGSTIPWAAFNSLAGQLGLRETAKDLVDRQRESAGLAKMSYDQKVETQGLQTAFGAAISKAESTGASPEEASLMAYHHIMQMMPAQGTAFQTMLFGSPDKAQQTITKWQNNVDKEVTEPLLADPSDPIGSLKTLSTQAVLDPKTGQKVLTPAAHAALRRLSSGEFSPTQFNQYDKMLQTEKDQLAQQGAVSTTLTKWSSDQIAKLPSDKQAVLSTYPPDVKNTLMALAFGPGDVSFDRVFPNREYRGTVDMSAQHAIGLLEELTDGKWSEQNYKAMTDLYKDMTAGKTHAAIMQYNNVLQHSAELQDAITNSLRGATPEILNHAINWMERHGWGAKAADITAAEEPLKDEYELLMSGGYKPSEEMQKAYDTILSPSATLGQIGAALKKMAGTGIIRLGTMNEQYKTVANGRNFPNIITPQAKAAAIHLGIGPNAANPADVETWNRIQALQTGGQLFGPTSSVSANAPTTQAPSQQNLIQVQPGTMAHKIGDIVYQSGHSYTVTGVNAQGQITGAAPQK